MSSPEAETSPPSTVSCATPRPLATAPSLRPALLRAARSGDERRLVKELLADPSAPDLETATTAGGNTLLHVAASGGHAALAALLLRRASGLLAACNAALDTPLHLAARAGAHKVAPLLIASSPSTSSLRALTRATNKRGETALHDAVRGGHEAAARALAAADPGLAGLCGGAGETPIYMATAAGSLGMVRALVKSYKNDDADEDEAPKLCSCTGPGRRTALHAAVLTSNEMTQELLQWNPALVKEVDDSGSTPLHYVASAGNISALKLLLRYDTSPAYVPDSNGLFPVHVAAKMGYGQLIYELCKHCPDSDEKLDGKGRNFLHIAVEYKKWKVVWHFCGTPELERMVNVMDYEGNTALHLAVKNADQMIVSLLMANKSVQPNIVNNKGLTALDLAVLATDKGMSYTLNPQVIILRCLAWTGAVLTPRRLDHFIDEFHIGKASGNELKKFSNIAQNLVVGSVLVSTVTFAAVFTLPGGNISDGHPHAGAPILSHRYTFKAFVMANTLAFVGSTLSTIWLTYAGSDHVHPLLRALYMFFSVVCMEQATRGMVAAFALGAYVVLSPVSERIAIVVCMSTIATLLLRNPSNWQLGFLFMPIKRRLGWRGAFKAHLPQQTRSRLTVGIGSNFACLILRRMLGMLFTYSFIFLLALL
ncbi:protein ACCELERATED CELL DEATH 6-like [Triticum dicoccoides]|uniref:protein ACCELERATED CELL DEATH 6-like n=1 Tax=Triticum dicoccoides TaxID=85692 RepID=UPI000E78FCBC|nr:protein ACCELERATED CELL DEATH 6-like [Triticum dicoccoides]